MRGDPKLQREVLPPQKQSSGLGVMVVAAAAMFFAVASSAFVLRARMARSHCDYVRSATPIIIQVDPSTSDNMPTQPPHATAAPTSDGCGAPVVTHNADGTESYSFTPCPDLELGADSKPVHGVTVRNIALVPDGR